MRMPVFVACVLFLLFCGCALPPTGDCRAPASDQKDRQICFDGQVVYVPLEGGFYGLTSDTGEKFDPVSLPESFRRDGLRVRVTARPLPRSVGTHMWGSKIEIVAIEKL